MTWDNEARREMANAHPSSWHAYVTSLASAETYTPYLSGDVTNEDRMR